MRITISRLVLADNKLVCPNCEWAIETQGNVKFISTLGSDQPRKAFAKCPQCATDIEISFTEEQPSRESNPESNSTEHDGTKPNGTV